MGFPDNVQCRWDPQGDGTFELQVLVSGFRYTLPRVLCWIAEAENIDKRKASPGRRESHRRNRICDERFVGQASDKAEAMAQVRRLSSPPYLLFSYTRHFQTVLGVRKM